MAGRPVDREDDEPAAVRPPRVFEPPDQAPGNPGWTRALLDTATAQREPLADGVARLPGIDPLFWRGVARERFTDARDRLTGDWRSVLDAHEAVLRRLGTYSTFVHELQHLWEADRDHPAARRHTAELHDRTTAALAEELLARAAELDAVAVAAEPVVEPPAPVDIATTAGHQEAFQPAVLPVVSDVPEVPATPGERYLLTEKLGVQLQTGVRVLRVPWESPRR
ncbi:hypothetical protein [Saccharothrix obliqua]|uniref:hypothetical protein n=1 Tax=Saccharothrix obliqua TaxID=2861747 RepID=UPI001C5EBAAD|nr:hypothetical protein [Saccharothrix obliqua]MBW4719684.1 hypothetical protein [Saccharothrix obliqua]